MTDKHASHPKPNFLDVDFLMKNQVKLFVGERSKTAFDSGCKMFDLYLNDNFQVGFSSIIFQIPDKNILEMNSFKVRSYCLPKLLHGLSHHKIQRKKFK